METLLSVFATARHVVRNAPTGAFSRLVSQAAGQFPELAIYLKMIPQLFTLSHIERFTPPQAVIVGSYILIIARILELFGSLVQAKVSVENTFKSAKTLLSKTVDKNPTQAMMRSICILNENQKLLNKLQLLFNLSSTNLMTYLHNIDGKLDDGEYSRNVALLEKELRDIKRTANIDDCTVNLKNGIPIADAEYTDYVVGDEYDIVDDAEEGGKGRRKTGKRKRPKSNKRRKTRNRVI